MGKKDESITFRAPRTMRKLVRKFIALDVLMNESDVYRHAVLKKIQRDAPHLYREVFQETTDKDE